jgi:hypothetical protein
MSNFGGRLGQPKKKKTFSGEFNRWWIFYFETDYTTLYESLFFSFTYLQIREKSMTFITTRTQNSMSVSLSNIQGEQQSRSQLTKKNFT